MSPQTLAKTIRVRRVLRRYLTPVLLDLYLSPLPHILVECQDSHIVDLEQVGLAQHLAQA